MLSLGVVIAAWEGAGMVTAMTNNESSTGMGTYINSPLIPMGWVYPIPGFYSLICGCYSIT